MIRVDRGTDQRDHVMEKKAKEIHYKKAALSSGKGTLQDALEGALKHLQIPGKRLERLGVNKDEGRVLLDPRHHNAMLSVTMSTYVQGTLQPIMGMKPGEKEWPIRQVQPPPLPGATETEFLDGYLFAGVWKDHVMVLPTRSCGMDQLEDHLNWLLRQCPHWPEGAVLFLNDRSPEEFRDKKFKRVQAFKLEAPIEAQPVGAPAPSSKPGTRTQKIQFEPRGATWEAICSFLRQFGGTLPEDMLLDQAFDPNDLRVKVEVTCKKKGLDRSGPLIDVLANSLRHVTTEVVKFTFDDGSELKGSDLKSHTSVRLECSGNMPIAQQVDQAMYNYLQELIQRGTIQ